MPENISKKQAAALKLAQDAKENFEVKATMEGLLDTVEESVVIANTINRTKLDSDDQVHQEVSRKETIVLIDDIDHERPPSRSMRGMPPFSSVEVTMLMSLHH
uniref:Uncharacterized protein n=1 Tax=Romanomermis culicivorax TaxID=13658 RepID=A0A915JXV7_ROMCU